MGTFAKRLGQLAAKGLETEGANILKTTRANKVPGSLAASLDRTLATGHDMRTFGLGTAASMANRERYGRFTASMFQASAIHSLFPLCCLLIVDGGLARFPPPNIIIMITTKYFNYS